MSRPVLARSTTDASGSSRPEDQGRRDTPHDRQVAENGSPGFGRSAAFGNGHAEGGVVPPILSNVFLNHVLDSWMMETVQPGSGACRLVRYADDSVIALECRLDGGRVLAALGARPAEHGLALHPTRTRHVDFRPKTGGHDPSNRFGFPGFTHLRGRTRKRALGRAAVHRQGAPRAGRQVGAGLVQGASAHAGWGSMPASCRRDPGTLRLLRPDGQRQTALRFPERRGRKLAALARTAPPQRADLPGSVQRRSRPNPLPEATVTRSIHAP